MIDNLVPAPKSTQYHYTLAGEIAMQTYDMDEPLIMELNYNLMLCNAAAVLVDKHLEMVHCSDQAAMIRMLTIFLFPSFPSPIPHSHISLPMYYIIPRLSPLSSLAYSNVYDSSHESPYLTDSHVPVNFFP